MTPLLLAAYIAGINPIILTAICQVESGLDAEAITLYDGGSHSYGLCQIKLNTARQMGYEEDGISGLFNPFINAQLAARYFKWQLKRYKGDERKAIIAYNKGHYKEGTNEQYYCRVRQAMGKSCD